MMPSVSLALPRILAINWREKEQSSVTGCALSSSGLEKGGPKNPSLTFWLGACGAPTTPWFLSSSRIYEAPTSCQALGWRQCGRIPGGRNSSWEDIVLPSILVERLYCLVSNYVCSLGKQNCIATWEKTSLSLLTETHMHLSLFIYLRKASILPLVPRTACWYLRTI